MKKFINLTYNEEFDENCSIFHVDRGRPVLPSILELPKTEEYDFLFKLLIIGDPDTGKSCLLSRYIDDIFYEIYIPTVGVDFKFKTLELEDLIIKLQIWDTAGQERFSTITSAYYQGADGILLVYDSTNGKTFNNLDHWLAEIEKHSPKNVSVMLVGNKIDLDSMQKVSYENELAYAQTHQLKFIEASCSNNKGVEEAFTGIIKEIINKRLFVNNEKKEEIIPTQSIEDNMKDQVINIESTTTKDAKETDQDGVDIKIVLCGDSQSGKTSFITRLTRNEFNNEFQPTFGVSFKSITHSYKEKTFKLQLWDGSGQLNFKALIPLYYHPATTIIMVYDCTNKESFFNLKNYLIAIHEYYDNNIKLIILGNKSDNEDKIINATQGKALADYLGAAFFEISCKNGFSSIEIITELLSQITEENLIGESIYSKIEKFINLMSDKEFNENCSIFQVESASSASTIFTERLEYEYFFKLIILGDSGTGKSSLLNRYVDDRFFENSSSYLGVEFKTKMLELENLLIKLIIWDTVGQERFGAISPAFYKGADGILLVYDCTNEETFNHLDYWLAEIKKHAQNNVSIILVANKIDLDSMQKVTNDNALAYAQTHQLTLIESSCSNNKGIEEAFSTLVREIVRKSSNQNIEDKAIESNTPT